jgi:hypothetical protein
MADNLATIVTEITGKNGFPTKGTIPVGRTLTGTFSSVGTIVTGSLLGREDVFTAQPITSSGHSSK